MGLYDSPDYAVGSVAVDRGVTRPLPPGHSTQFYTQPSFVDIPSLAEQMGEEATRALQSRLSQIGALSGDYRIGEFDPKTVAALENAFEGAAYNDMTLTEYLFGMGGSLQDAAASSASDGSGNGPQPTTSTSTSVSLTGRPTARAVLTQALTAWKGAAPSKKEVDSFLKGLNASERANPSVSTSRSDGRGNTTTTSKSSPVDPSAKAQVFAEKHGGKEAERYQTANYMDALASMVGM